MNDMARFIRQKIVKGTRSESAKEDELKLSQNRTKLGVQASKIYKTAGSRPERISPSDRGTNSASDTRTA